MLPRNAFHRGVPPLACAAVLAVLTAGPLAAEPIGSLHCNDAEGLPTLKGRSVTVTGVVTAQFSTQRNVKLCVQDATGGIAVFGSPKDCAAIGDSVRVTGVVTGYGGLTEITGTAETPVGIEHLGGASRVPAPLPLTPAQVLATEQPDGCEPNESRLVALENVTFLAGDGSALPEGATFADDTNYRLVAAADTTRYVVLRVTDPEGCDLSQSLEGQPIPRGAPVRIVGILSQYAGRSRNHGGYQLLPRGREDVQAPGAKVTPGAGGR